MLGAGLVSTQHFPLKRIRFNHPFLARCSANGAIQTSLEFPAQDFQSYIWQTFQKMKGLVREQCIEFQKIEWPSFENTVKTSVFVIVLSFLLIVALTAIDTGYTFVLSRIMR